MALKYLVDINLSGNEIQNAALQTVAGEPTGLAEGHVIYDTLTKQVKVYNGVDAWNVVGLTADETSLTTSAAGVISIKDLGVSTAKIANLAVTTGKIANDAVTFAKLQDIGVNTIVGRNNTGTGDAEALTPAEVRTMINVEDGANNYSLPTASATVLGGVKVGTDLSIASGVLDAGSNIPRLNAANTFALDQTFSSDVIVSGNLTVNGTTTSVNSTDLEVTDKLVTFNVGNTVPAAADGSGFQIVIDGLTNTGIVWNDAQQRFVWLEPSGAATRVFALQDEIRTNEQIEDLVGAMFSGNTETGITATYQDADGTIDLVVAEQRTDEQVMDLVADVMAVNPSHVGITATDDDASNAVTLTNSYVHSLLAVLGHLGGTFVTSLSGAGLLPDTANPVTVQVFEFNTTSGVKTAVITEVVVDGAADSISIELPAGDYHISLAGFRA